MEWATPDTLLFGYECVINSYKAERIREEEIHRNQYGG